MEIVKLKPAYKNYLWGGNNLKSFGKVDEDRIIAESWEASVHKDGLSIVTSGSESGKTFLDYLKDHPNYLGKDLKEFPILIKFIDSARPLSIQVHPNDEYAIKNENELGKTEVWYVVDAKDDAYIYYGVNKDTSKEEIREKIENGTLPSILNKVNVKKGDCYLIEAGTIHAIGEGIVILEIQENSNSTYRLYDYNRKDINGNKRPLHIDKALDVALLKPSSFKDRKDCNILSKTEYFDVSLIEVNENTSVNTGDYYNVLTVIEGNGYIDDLEINKGDSVFVPYGINSYSLKGNMKIIKTTK